MLLMFRKRPFSQCRQEHGSTGPAAAMNGHKRQLVIAPFLLRCRDQAFPMGSIHGYSQPCFVKPKLCPIYENCHSGEFSIAQMGSFWVPRKLWNKSDSVQKTLGLSLPCDSRQFRQMFCNRKGIASEFPVEFCRKIVPVSAGIIVDFILDIQKNPVIDKMM